MAAPTHPLPAADAAAHGGLMAGTAAGSRRCTFEMKRALFFAMALIVGCSDQFPQDAEGTLRGVRAERIFSVGVVAPLAAERQGAVVHAVIAEIGRAAGAKARIETGDAEPLLQRLEDGELDLVIGRFGKKTPWAKLVTIGPPIAIEKRGETEFHLAPAMRNGENAWIALVEREARDISPDAQ